jgi:excisionase family DNA binding protein
MRPRVFLTRNEARREFPGLARRALDRALATGELPAYRFDTWARVRRDDLQAWIERHRRPGR